MIRKLPCGEYRLYSRKKDAKTGQRKNRGLVSENSSTRRPLMFENLTRTDMELRKHPRMKCLGRPNWPPEWRGPYGADNPLPRGEVGILARVEPAPSTLKPPHCIVVMQHNRQEYLASLYFDDEEFLQQIVRLFRSSLGRPIAEIGSLDIP